MYEDKTLVCKDCGKEFVFTAGEQEFYAEKGFQNEPLRCKECRDARKASRGAHNHNGQAKERNRGSKPLSKNVNLRSQSNNERPRPTKAIAWSKQGSKATISKAIPRNCPPEMDSSIERTPLP